GIWFAFLLDCLADVIALQGGMLMKSRALGLLMTSGLLISSVLTAEPLTDLRARFAALRNSQPIRLQVEIEAKSSESSPLHRTGAKLTGRATVVYGPTGVKVRGQ